MRACVCVCVSEDVGKQFVCSVSWSVYVFTTLARRVFYKSLCVSQCVRYAYVNMEWSIKTHMHVQFACECLGFTMCTHVLVLGLCRA